jgi:4-amino-4-deoxy-L-arabinose transferase-like glycosyltransferase
MNVSPRRVLFLVFLAALAPRIAMALWLPQEIVWIDGNRYEVVALNLLGGEGFGDLLDNSRSVPTQPLLIAAVFSVFGHNYLALRLVSAVIGAVSCVVGCQLARSLFGPTAAVFAGLMLALYPHLVYVSALFEYPQTLGILLVGTFLLVCVRFADERSVATRFVAGLLLGTIILTLPSLLIYAPVFLLLLYRRDCSRGQNAGFVAAALAGLVLTVGSWTWRNYAAYQQVIFVNMAAGVNLWVANNETYALYGKPAVVPACGKGYEWTDYCKEHLAVFADIKRRNLSTTMQVVELDRQGREHATRFVREHPLQFAQLTARKVVQLWSPWPDAVTTGRAQGGAYRNLISALAYIPVLVLGCAGLILSARQRWRRLVPVYVFMVTFIAPFAVFLPTMRYRLPLDYLLILFASVPLARLWTMIAEARRHQRAEFATSARRFDSLQG